MKRDKSTATAGLVFTSAIEFDIVEAANHVASGFKALEHDPNGLHIHSDTIASVSTDTHVIELKLEEDVPVPFLESPAAQYLTVRIHNITADNSTFFARDSLLARALQSLHRGLGPDFVKWIDSDVLLPGADFASATDTGTETSQTTKKVRRAKAHAQSALPDIDETNRVLQDRIDANDPKIFAESGSSERARKVLSGEWVDPEIVAIEAAEAKRAREIEDIEKEAPLRLSAWIISFAVSLFALPVGIALLVLNLMKGENLRLASQTAALTGTFFALQSNAATAQTIQALQSFIG